MTGTATLTGKSGPANTLTAVALTGVKRVELDIEHNMAYFFHDAGITEIDMTDTSGITHTVTEGVSIATTITNA